MSISSNDDGLISVEFLDLLRNCCARKGLIKDIEKQNSRILCDSIQLQSIWFEFLKMLVGV
jgi:hypothetical protein